MYLHVNISCRIKAALLLWSCEYVYFLLKSALKVQSLPGPVGFTFVVSEMDVCWHRRESGCSSPAKALPSYPESLKAVTIVTWQANYYCSSHRVMDAMLLFFCRHINPSLMKDSKCSYNLYELHHLMRKDQVPCHIRTTGRASHGFQLSHTSFRSVQWADRISNLVYETIISYIL